MKIELDLDVSKLDYDLINSKIAEKIEEVDLGSLDIKSLIDSKINTMIADKVEYNYDPYLSTYWKEPTSDGKKLITSITKEEIERRCTTEVNAVLDELGDESIRKIVLSILPEAMTTILLDRLSSAIFNTEFSYTDSLRNVIRSDINNSIRRVLPNLNV